MTSCLFTVRLSCCLQNSGLTARLHDSTSSPSRSAERSLSRETSTASVQPKSRHRWFKMSTISVTFVTPFRGARGPHPVQSLAAQWEQAWLRLLFPHQMASCLCKPRRCTRCPPPQHHLIAYSETQLFWSKKLRSAGPFPLGYTTLFLPIISLNRIH